MRCESWVMRGSSTSRRAMPAGRRLVSHVPCLMTLLVFSVWGAGVDEFPQKTEDGWTLPPRATQLRCGGAFWEEDDGPEVQEYVLSYSRGFEGGFELGAGLPFIASDPPAGDSQTGFSDLRLYAEVDIGQHLFFEWESPVDALSFSFAFYPRFGRSAKKFEIYDRTAEVTLNTTQDLEAHEVAIHGNFGVVWYDDTFEPVGENVESALLLRLGLSRPFAKGSVGYADLAWQENPDDNDHTDLAQFGGGVRFPTVGGMSVDAGLWLGLTDPTPDLQVAVGLTRVF